MGRPRVEIVNAPRAVLGESPFWDAAAGVLWWTDIEGGLVHRFDPASGATSTIEIDGKAAFAVPCLGGNLALGTERGIFTLDPQSGDTRPIADPEADRRQNRFNDVTVDHGGRLIAGTSAVAPPPAGPEAAFWRIDGEGAATRLMDGLYTCNGLAFSPDGRWLYLSDSNERVQTVWRGPYEEETGRLGPVEVFFDARTVAGRPDGGTVDAEGCYWTAAIGGGELVRLTPAGAIDRTVPLPVTRPTKPAFGGAHLDTLFVTSMADERGEGGLLLAVTGLGVTGAPIPRAIL